MDLSIDIKQLNQDQTSESDHHDIGEGVTEHEQTEHHDGGTLEEGLPEPDAEGFEVHLSTLFQSLVQRRIAHDALLVSVFVKHKGENWK